MYTEDGVYRQAFLEVLQCMFKHKQGKVKVVMIA